MKVAVITPYHRETPEVLRRCVDSVQAQTKACTHFLVADGHPHEEVGNWGVQHIVLPCAHGDYGDTPRMIGTASAFSQGFDAVCWLDADNWFDPNHVELLAFHAMDSQAEVVTATRRLYTPDGELIDVCTESDGVNFNDTSCYFITRAAMGISPLWVFKDPNLAVVGDRVMWDQMKQFRRAHCPTPTVNYTSYVAVHYLGRNLTPPENCRIIVTLPGEKYPKSLLYSDFTKLGYRLR